MSSFTSSGGVLGEGAAGSPSRWLSATAAASARRRQAKRVRRPWSAAAFSAKRVVATRKSRPGCGWGRRAPLGVRSARRPVGCWRQAHCRGGAADRSQPRPRQHAALPAARPDRRRRAAVSDKGHVAADQRAVLPSGRAERMAAAARDRRTDPAEDLRPTGRGDRRGRRPRPRAALPDRLHERPRPRDGVLAVPPQPPPGAPRRPPPNRARGRRGRAGDRRRRPRALRLHVRRPAGPHRHPRLGLRGLRDQRRREARRRGSSASRCPTWCPA